MPVFRKAVDRLADLLRHDRKITYRVHIDARTAPYVVPLIGKMLADDEDGEAYRTALIDWHRSERPPLAVYRGDVSTCRIDGPTQWAGDSPFPLGGLILSPGVTAHLDPFEARALREQMREAIEQVIRSWVAEHDLLALPPVPQEIDRRKADPAAKALIAAWAGEQENPYALPGTIPNDASDDGADALNPGVCALCGKGSNHA